MGKAFSDEERAEIKIALMESALELFHEQGKKSLSIRELTKRAGISQGGFYTFWEDKDALILDVIRYRAAQKLEAIVPLFPESLASPRKFWADHLYSWCIDLKVKILTKPIYQDSIKQLRRQSADDSNRMSAIYSDFLIRLSDYWHANQAVKEVDINGLINLLAAIGVLMSEQIQLDGDYFDQLLRILIDGSTERFIII
ncbi:MAG: TetR/AcrR family transcriptional regulator [Lachnospiraceae bacterium]|nr:TetR/AcrR family transcriptional regulator [Lachnospiraceae bacterium]